MRRVLERKVNELPEIFRVVFVLPRPRRPRTKILQSRAATAGLMHGRRSFLAPATHLIYSVVRRI
jgi:hypothetical protein